MVTPSGLPTLAVTGATGGLGGLVARALSEAGVAQRLLVRTVTKAPQLPGATVLPVTYADRVAGVAALTGVETLFMVSASESADRLDQHMTFIDAAQEAGVGHVVYTSFVGAAPDATFTLGRDHFNTEVHLRSSGMAVTFLRDNLYLDFMTALVGDDDVIRGPAGDGRVAAVARADIARVALTVLQDPGAHRGQTYDLTGPEALTMTEIAAALTTHLDRPITFHDETVPEAYASRAKWGAPDWQNDAWVSTYTSIAAGDVARVTTDVETLTDRRPMSLAEVLATNAP